MPRDALVLGREAILLHMPEDIAQLTGRLIDEVDQDVEIILGARVSVSQPEPSRLAEQQRREVTRDRHRDHEQLVRGQQRRLLEKRRQAKPVCRAAEVIAPLEEAPHACARPDVHIARDELARGLFF